MVDGNRQISKVNRLEKVMIESLEPLIKDLGYQLWDVVWVASQRILRVFISHANMARAITHADCTAVSCRVDSVVEAKVPEVHQRYHLEVSSLGSRPGIRTADQLRMFVREPLEFTDRLGAKFTAVVEGVKSDGLIEWGAGAGDKKPPCHISEFRRIRVKNARI